jgi:phosphoribosyl-AMP cyclohydrolase / phosphoribosyl-ATP pyrophosphohydrolase
MSEDLIQNLQFDEQGLIPAVIQDHATNEVLMVAWMNAESLGRTLQTGETWFWSRSRQELWHKGATSGNIQKVVDLRLDCDADTLLIKVRPQGPACHTGESTCFHRQATLMLSDDGKSRNSLTLVDVGALDLGILLNDLYEKIAERERTRPEKSYTTYLFTQGLDKILKKIGEEAAETIIAAKSAAAASGEMAREQALSQLASEICDLLYHLVVLMVERGVKLPEIVEELSARIGRPALPKYDTPK